MFAPELITPAFRQSFIKLDPRMMFRNPVMFAVEIGTFVMFFVTIYSYTVQDPTIGRFGYNVAIFFVLFLTLLFANFAQDIFDDAYMETFMNWPVLLRSEEDVWNIINASVDRNTVDVRVFSGENGNIIYGVITKRD